MKKILKIALLLGTIIFLWAGIVIGTDYNDIRSIVVLEKSDEFKRWESLSPDERSNTIEPMYSSIPFKQTIKRSVYNTLLQSNTNEDTKYSLINKDNDNINMIVKNQNKVGACWAFAYSSVIESNIAKKNQLTTTTAISPMHIDYKTANMYNRKLGSGGSVLMALTYGANGYGPVYETALPFESVYDELNNKASNYYLKDKSEVTLNQQNVARIKEMNLYMSSSDKEKAREKIKQHIKENGALMATMYVDFGITASEEYISQHGFYNSTNKAFYCNDEDYGINHAVTIVGWDDTFKKERFATGKQPSINGAWIVLNSYGEQFGDYGYFYVSYEDVHIQNALLGIGDITEYTENSKKEYDYIYQYDDLGMNQALNTPYLANVFNRQTTKQKDYAEYLNEVGIQLMSAQGVEIYVNTSGNDFSKLTKVASYTGENALDAGYHTIKLATPIEITGEQFIVAVNYINSEDVVAPIECNLMDSGFSMFSTNYDTATANEGESYYSTDGSIWKDLNGLKIGIIQTLKNTNACIKAFTVKNKIEMTDVTGVSLNYKNYEMKVGEKFNLQVTVAPSNATNKNVTWTTSNAGIAIVSNTGEVTAIKDGVVTITVTTEDGNYTDNCSITVKKDEPIQESIKATGVSLNYKNYEIKVGEKFNLQATVAPSNATNKNVIWTTSNAEIATVSNTGEVTAIKDGVVTITVTTEDGNYTDNCSIIVKKDEPIQESIKVTGVSLNYKEYTMTEGATGNLVATITPENATNKRVTWLSSNANVATVTDTGIITAISAGKTTIIVKTIDGEYVDTCELTVNKKIDNSDDIYIPEDKENIDGDTNSNDNGKNEVENIEIPAKDEDLTIADKVLPNTGITTIIMLMVAVSAIAIIIYIKVEKYKDLK